MNPSPKAYFDKISHLNLFCWNRWTKLNQILLGCFLGCPLYVWQPSLNLRWQSLLKIKMSLFVDALIIILFKMSSNFYYSCMAISSSKYICKIIHKITVYFLAHLAKGNVSFCHHLTSVVRRPLTFHILIFSSETP
jgi:hypothetical protein